MNELTCIKITTKYYHVLFFFQNNALSFDFMDSDNDPSPDDSTFK